MYSFAEARIKSERPFAVIKGGKEAVNAPANREFTDIGCGLLADYFELACLFSKNTQFDLSKKIEVGNFTWTPGTVFDSLQYKDLTVRWGVDGNIVFAPFLTESEWLHALDQAWTEVVEVKSRAESR